MFFKICLPQVIAGLAATFVFGLILTWNEFLFALLLTGPDTRTVPVAMNQAVSSGGRGTDWTLLAAIETLFLIPVFLVTFFLQNHLLRGVTFGTVRKLVMSTIEIRKITKTFGDFTAVRDADLSVAAGEVVCLLGPSGCGKTTTLRMIAGLERATAGDVIIAGQRMNDLPPEKRNIAMVFQFYALYPALTVGQNIAMPLHYEGIGSAEMAARVKQGGRHPASDRGAGPLARPGLRRREAAHRGRPRHRARSQLLPVRRAPVAPRRGAAPFHARPDQGRACPTSPRPRSSSPTTSSRP